MLFFPAETTAMVEKERPKRKRQRGPTDAVACRRERESRGQSGIAKLRLNFKDAPDENGTKYIASQPTLEGNERNSR